jgi:hypothetical protein
LPFRQFSLRNRACPTPNTVRSWINAVFLGLENKGCSILGALVSCAQSTMGKKGEGGLEKVGK